MWLLRDVAQVVVARRAQIQPALRVAPITAAGADISARDNAELAQATAAIAAAFAGLRDRGLIDDAEYLRMVYRFAGEPVDVAGLLARAKPKDEG
jgi:hypothetical protein